MAKAVLIYDGECGFCRRWVARWRKETGRRVAYVPSQRRGALRRFAVAPRDAARATQLIDPDGRRYSGARAVFRLLAHGRTRWKRVASRLGLLPGIISIAEGVYTLVARHRTTASRIELALSRRAREEVGRNSSAHSASRHFARSGHVTSAVRALGAVYGIAFRSLRGQLLGLYGERGVLPVREVLDDVRDDVFDDVGRPTAPLARLRAVPSLLWLDPSDAGLLRLCRVGELASTALMLGIAPRASAAVCYATYLSFVSVGRDFLSFQWDALLLEAGLATAVGPQHSLLAFLACRLHFESGLAKLQSGDRTWRNASACAYHFETQPLPTPLGWYVHHLPRRGLRAASAAAVAVECIAPWLALPGLGVVPVGGPTLRRRLRRAAVLALTGFQVLVAATGNFGFFNVLSVALNLALLQEPVRPRRPRRRLNVGDALAGIAAVPIVALAVSNLWRRVQPRAWRRFARRHPTPIGQALSRALTALRTRLAPFYVVSSYGLFSVMTTRRPEIVIEGSHDGVTWKEYEFRYKAGNVHGRPRWVAPHQPRLDWQMWFAALSPMPPTWFVRLLGRLLEGSPPVVALFAANPFPHRPPRYVRAVLYDYKMTALETRRRTGAWWQRTAARVYFPACRLADGRSSGRLPGVAAPQGTPMA